ncbi:class I SAM-dependent methyltransferase [Catellatospora coxensis]|uniref:Methyltransferase domain-containing protein n=1 Tax=Catellatospora coxensis TaxID=310354 RepID=A0A8J3PA17_9ACTN|nr:class I SAM-dependent methyltransferase [Catellatospora coxensis]GIG07376.1 hypothetical protein Cco03nite_40760 [Catellatospora coxensis]
MTEEFSKAYWEDRYHGHTAGHGRPPNPHLVAETSALTPGTALDAGCGEGAEAIWLAARGWQVTAVDIAESALRHARSHAQAAGETVAGRIEWRRADLSGWTPPAQRYDLVCSHYVHPAASRESLAARLAAAVAPGGTLLIVGHHPSDRRPGVSDAAVRDVHFTADEVAAVLDPDQWEIVAAESRHRPATGPDGHGDHGHHGHGHTLHDTVLRARRLP